MGERVGVEGMSQGTGPNQIRDPASGGVTELSEITGKVGGKGGRELESAGLSAVRPWVSPYPPGAGDLLEVSPPPPQPSLQEVPTSAARRRKELRIVGLQGKPRAGNNR